MELKFLHKLAASRCSIFSAAQTHNLFPYEILYIYYCREFDRLDGQTTPDLYDCLRLFLQQRILRTNGAIINYLTSKDFPFNLQNTNKKNTCIIDVGSGHFELLRCFNYINDSLSLVAIDKADISPAPDWAIFYQTTIQDFTLFDEWRNDHILWVLSDFLHCKIGNQDIISELLKSGDVLIREYEYDEYLEDRFTKVGGRIVDPLLLAEQFPGITTRHHGEHYWHYIKRNK